MFKGDEHVFAVQKHVFAVQKHKFKAQKHKIIRIEKKDAIIFKSHIHSHPKLYIK